MSMCDIPEKALRTLAWRLEKQQLTVPHRGIRKGRSGGNNTLQVT